MKRSLWVVDEWFYNQHCCLFLACAAAALCPECPAACDLPWLVNAIAERTTDPVEYPYDTACTRGNDFASMTSCDTSSLPSYNTVFVAWKPLTSDIFTIDTCRTVDDGGVAHEDTVIQVYREASCFVPVPANKRMQHNVGRQTCSDIVAQADDSQSEYTICPGAQTSLDIEVTEGVTYIIAVGQKSREEYGPGMLVITPLRS